MKKHPCLAVHSEDSIYKEHSYLPPSWASGQREDEKERRKSNLIFKYKSHPITKPKQGSPCVTNRENSVCLNKYTYQFASNFLQVTKEIIAITSNPIANVHPCPAQSLWAGPLLRHVLVEGKQNPLFTEYTQSRCYSALLLISVSGTAVIWRVASEWVVITGIHTKKTGMSFHPPSTLTTRQRCDTNGIIKLTPLNSPTPAIPILKQNKTWVIDREKWPPRRGGQTPALGSCHPKCSRWNLQWFLPWTPHPEAWNYGTSNLSPGPWMNSQKGLSSYCLKVFRVCGSTRRPAQSACT